MVEGIRVAPREEPRDPESSTEASAPRAPGEKPAKARPLAGAAQVVRDAFADAKAVLDSRDPAKNGDFKLAAHLGWGVPVWYAFASALLLAQREQDLRALTGTPGRFAALAAVFFLGGLVGPLVVPFATVFPLTLAFYALQGDATRKRLRQALVCPYCRDEVEREGTVICARTKCGALYHRECWDECSKQYGGCAVYGCSSKKCREVSAAGFLLRMAKLALAAVLFPPRVARALRTHEDASAASVYKRALESARGVYFWTNASSRRQTFFVLALGVPLSYVPVIWWRFTHTHSWDSDPPPSLIVSVFGTPFLMLALPYILAIPLLFAFYFAKGVKRALEAEFSALARADEGGGTVLGRIASGFGAKKS